MGPMPRSTMRLTPAERAVILGMRYNDDAGDAIYRYAMNFDSYDPYPSDTTPYQHETHPYEQAFPDAPGEHLTE